MLLRARHTRPQASRSCRLRATSGCSTDSTFAQTRWAERDPQPGFIDHVGIGVPDLAATKEYYDGLMSALGLREWFPTAPRAAQLRAGRSPRLAALLLPSGAGDLLAQPTRPPSPRIPGREQNDLPERARMGARARCGHPRRATGVPPVRRALLRDLLARPLRVQARGGLPHSRGELRRLTPAASEGWCARMRGGTLSRWTSPMSATRGRNCREASVGRR